MLKTRHISNEHDYMMIISYLLHLLTVRGQHAGYEARGRMMFLEGKCKGTCFYIVTIWP